MDTTRESTDVRKATRRRRQVLADRAGRYHDSLTLAIDRLEAAIAAPAVHRTQVWSERIARELSTRLHFNVVGGSAWYFIFVGGSRDAEATACPVDVADLLRVFEDSLLTPDF